MEIPVQEHFFEEELPWKTVTDESELESIPEHQTSIENPDPWVNETESLPWTDQGEYPL